ncbi:uncharacterized protein MAM_06220 [Metarhizium album ARSEF 1941]|uniref:Chromosome segregation ATPase family protein n=1 Tax=Metarhizium album (strain ARSEF 1941) TaxID=1081103 RepID=A0A0B2WPB9_METAS|nr:uncharacterized protein MAM_06220 [Metarhizium album ARSEF 1941]KHN95858.1 hypothetical protein MAM_06220 [Metarhizium album ARSEF 1941]
MSLSEWDSNSSRDGERYLKHQHSASSDHGVRALVPMWDSSDPERAPPPLPLNPNPQSPGFTSRAGTSSAIQSAHAVLSERARENGAVVRRGDGSPERALVKGGSHRRLQSLQPGSVRDLSLMIEGNWSRPDRRPSTPTTPRELPPEPRSDRDSANSTPVPGPSLTPILRPTARRLPQSILGENTPPQSSTMLALQNMGAKASPREAEPALSNITNGATPRQLTYSEDVSAQLLKLTNIATSLQKEMSALSRRSRDNATDLLSLKEATKSRDEDVRKSLRELVGNINEQSSRITSFNGPYLDNKPFGSPPTHSRAFQLPRIPSPKSFAESIDRGSISTPSLSGVDTPASLLLLEKIWNGLGTKEGQESLVGLLTQLSQKLSGLATSTKVDELAEDIRSRSENAVVLGSATRSGNTANEEMDLERGSLTSQRVDRLLYNGQGRRSSVPSGRGAELVNQDLLNIIRSVKDSVTQGGGLTAEVKALVRELRGEVLGMGRELGKRLEKVGNKGIEEAEVPSKDEVSRVIDEGLEQMKEQLNNVLREHRRQSAQSQSSQKTVVDYQEIYNAMRAALRDNEASADETPDLSREDVIEAVKDAWENYKPEIEVQQLGLERDEVLACLKQGLQEYAARDERPEAATREEVFKAVVEGLKHFVPPKVETPASLSRDEIIDAVRDCLEEFEFPIAPSAVAAELSHRDVVEAVREGLSELDLPRNDALMAVPNNNDEVASRLREIMEFMKLEFKTASESHHEAVHRAVRDGLSGLDLPRSEALVAVPGSNEEVLSRLQDMMEYMKLEFKAVSEEAKDNVAANGRDTEQVLDATKDGLENLRMAIEAYVDRVSGNAGHEELMENMSRTMEDFKEEVSRAVSLANDSSREELHAQLEGLREIVNSSMIPAPAPTPPSVNNQDVLEALHNGLTSLRQEILRPRPETGDILDAIQDGLNDLRAAFERVVNKPVDLTANDEVLDALKSGLESVRSDIETLRDSGNERAVAAVATADEDDSRAIIPADMVKQDDIKNLEVLITQLRIKVEAMDSETEPIQRDDLVRLEEMIRNVQEGVGEISAREATATAEPAKEAREASDTTNGDAASKDDVQAIETILRNTKASLDDLIEGEQAVRKEHLDAIESLVLETRETMTSMSEQLATISQKEDLTALEALVTQLSLGVEEIKERSDKAPSPDDEELATKTGVEAVEAVVLEIKTAIETLTSTDFANMSNKEDISNLQTVLEEAKEKIDAHAESATKALDDRQAEIVGVADRVAAVKTLLEEFQEVIKGKLEDGSSGIDAVAKSLEGIGEKIDKNENVSADLKEMFETMKTQFEENKEVVAGARLESNEKLQEATDGIGSKIDDKMTELIAKYDELKATLSEKSEKSEAREIETEAAVVGTKAIAEDLKLLIDTLGSTVTDSLEKMEEASKTVFSKVEDVATRTEEFETEGKNEHQKTRDHIEQAVAAVESLQGEVKEHQSEILTVVKDILLLVGEHFEHSKSATTELQDKIAEAKPVEQQMLPPPEKYDDSAVQEKLSLIAEQKYDDSEIKEKLDRLVEQRYDDGPVHEKLDRLAEHRYDDSTVHEKLDRLVEQRYDDSTVHEKLDRLVDHSATSVQASAQLEKLDKVHQSVVNTAAEISQFLSSQTQRIENEDEDREKSLQDTVIELERKLAERDHMEAAVLSLKDEVDRLRNSVLHLRTEQESLVRQKTRLTGDVSSLETALRLRKEELSEMEHRAERLERRIVEGVMDHSRVLLMAKSSKGRDSMDRKRVRKPIGEEGEAGSTKSNRPAVNMALATKRNVGGLSQNGSARRIASLSQMTSSSPSGLVKRSQSVRTAAGNALRKRSWGGGLAKGFGEENKENVGVGETVEELDEPDAAAPSPVGSIVSRDSLADDDGQGSDTGTLRRSSVGTTVMSSQYTDSEGGYGEYDGTESDWTESQVGTDVGAGDGNGLVVYGQQRRG